MRIQISAVTDREKRAAQCEKETGSTGHTAPSEVLLRAVTERVRYGT